MSEDSCAYRTGSAGLFGAGVGTFYGAVAAVWQAETVGAVKGTRTLPAFTKTAGCVNALALLPGLHSPPWASPGWLPLMPNLPRKPPDRQSPGVGIPGPVPEAPGIAAYSGMPCTSL